MNRQALNRSLFISCFTLAACGGGGGTSGGGTTPTNLPPPVISFNHIFPQGDATASQGVAWDIVGVKTTLSGQFGDSLTELYDTLRVDVTFAQDISKALPAPGAVLASGSQIGIGIGFDVDNNSKTGSFSVCDQASGINPFELISDPGQLFGRLADGNYSILNAGGQIVSGGSEPSSEALTSSSGHVLSESFYLPALHVASGASIPKIGVNVGAVNGTVKKTDCVPSSLGELHTDHQ